MKQRLQGPASGGIRVALELFRHQGSHNSSGEVVLVGKPGDGQAIRFRAFGQTGPIDVRGKVGLADFGER